MLASCTEQEAMLSPEEQARQDSLALHVAVMPISDCLPIYYAERTGLFDSLGVDVRLMEFMSQMDCDTALMRDHAQLGYTDMPRIILMQGEGAQLRVVMQLQGRLQLVGARTKRLRALKNLKEKMVALSRHSYSDYWSDCIMEKAGLQQNDIYRPQINDVQLRLSMLCEQLIDAALLPEPYGEVARLRGNTLLFTTPDSTSHFPCLVIQKSAINDKHRKAQTLLFIKGYNQAVSQLNALLGEKSRNMAASGSLDSLHVILKQNFGIPSLMADTIALPHFTPAQAPQKETAQTAERWLRQRGKLPRGYKADSLFNLQFVEP